MTVTNSRKAKPYLDIEVDGRTAHMSEVALYCRKRGHKWEERGMSRRHYNELIAQRVMEEDMYCDNGCGSTWFLSYSTRTGEILENKRSYPKTGDYLMPPGEGRLDRATARLAHLARRAGSFR